MYAGIEYITYMELVTLLPFFFPMWNCFVLDHVNLCISYSFLLKSHICSQRKVLLLCSQISVLGVHFITSPLGKSLTLISLFANSPHMNKFLITNRVGLHSKGYHSMYSSLLWMRTQLTSHICWMPAWYRTFCQVH